MISEEIIAGLSPQQSTAITMLVEGQLPNDIADALGIAVGTLYNWKLEPTFKAALKKTQLAVYQASLLELKALSSTATRTLKAIVVGSEVAPRDRIAAAKAILSFGQTNLLEANTKEEAAHSIGQILAHLHSGEA